MRGGSRHAAAINPSLMYVSGLMTSDFDLIVDRTCPPSQVKKFHGMSPMKIEKNTWCGLIASIWANDKFISQLGDPGKTLKKVR